MADWQSIKTEYITTNTSYRKLAKKYGVSYNAIGNRSREEKWQEQRDQHLTNTMTKTLEIISKQEASRAARVQTVADKLLKKIEAMVDSDDPLDTKGLRALTAAVKDLKEIQSIKSDLDRQEQEARIANLRKQANPEQQQDTPKLVVEGLPEEFKI